jgi:glycine cleavage system aminomethyltransferase T
MAIEQEIRAIRSSVALTELDQVSYLRVSGPDAFDGMDAVCPKELFIRDGQMLHTLLLDEQACVLADAYVGADDADFLLLVDGLSACELESYLRRHMPPHLDVELEDLGSSRRLLALNGPYAWELMAKTFSAEIIGLPYLGFYHDPRFTCFRTGQTGEYGYLLSVPREEWARVRAELASRASEFDLTSAGLAALDCCALENWFFNIRGEGSARLTPLELGLQWRVSYHKVFPGSAALGERRRARRRQRATLVRSDR